MIRIIFSVITIVLASIVLIRNENAKVIVPYMLTCLGIIQIFNSIYLYKEDKKIDSIMLFSSSVFILVVVIIILKS